jgi:hypothetical protein
MRDNGETEKYGLKMMDFFVIFLIFLSEICIFVKISFLTLKK